MGFVKTDSTVEVEDIMTGPWMPAFIFWMEIFLKGNGHSINSIRSLNCVHLCGPINCSMPGLPVHHQLLEFTQTYVHWVDDAIQPSHPLSSPSPPSSIFPSIRVFSKESALDIRWPSIGVSASASVLPVNIQNWFPLGWTGWISLKAMVSCWKLLIKGDYIIKGHSSILAWEIPWMEEPGGFQSLGLQRVRHEWVTEHI